LYDTFSNTPHPSLSQGSPFQGERKAPISINPALTILLLPARFQSFLTEKGKTQSVSNFLLRFYTIFLMGPHWGHTTVNGATQQ